MEVIIVEDINERIKEIICPQCLQIPYFIFMNQEIIVNCTMKCNLKVYKSEDLFQKLENIFSENPMCQIKSIHSHQNAVKYCCKCEKWLCSDCVNQHVSSHNLVENIEQNILNIYCKVHKNNQTNNLCIDCQECYCNECELVHKDHESELIKEGDLKYRKKVANNIIIKKKFNEHLKICEKKLNSLKNELEKVKFNSSNDKRKEEELQNKMDKLERLKNNEFENYKKEKEYCFRALNIVYKSISEATIYSYIIYKNLKILIDLLDLVPFIDFTELKEVVKFFQRYPTSEIKLEQGNENTIKPIKTIFQSEGNILCICFLKNKDLLFYTSRNNIYIYDVNLNVCKIRYSLDKKNEPKKIKQIIQFPYWDFALCDEESIKFYEISNNEIKLKRKKEIQIDKMVLDKSLGILGISKNCITNISFEKNENNEAKFICYTIGSSSEDKRYRDIIPLKCKCNYYVTVGTQAIIRLIGREIYTIGKGVIKKEFISVVEIGNYKIALFNKDAIYIFDVKWYFFESKIECNNSISTKLFPTIKGNLIIFQSKRKEKFALFGNLYDTSTLIYHEKTLKEIENLFDGKIICLTKLDNEAFALGCEDGKIRIFSI